MRKSDCKIGDEVVLVNSSSMRAMPGARGHIYHICKSYIHIKWIRDGLSLTQADGSYDANNFEIAANPKTVVNPEKIDYMKAVREIVARG
jgi:hypothetical protein